MDLHRLRTKDFDFWTHVKTRWSDMDSLEHVNHTAYLSYMETARVDLYKQLGYKGINKAMNESTILAGLEVTYLARLSHPSSLKIGYRIIRVGTKSYDLISGVFFESDDTSLCLACFKLVSFNYKTNQSILVPEKIRENCRPVS